MPLMSEQPTETLCTGLSDHILVECIHLEILLDGRACLRAWMALLVGATSAANPNVVALIIACAKSGKWASLLEWRSFTCCLG